MVEIEDPGERPGVPDAFQRLWTPHRMVYIGGQDKPATALAEDCPFCSIPARSDRDAGAVSFRFRDGTQENGIPVADAVARIREAIASKAQV